MSQSKEPKVWRYNILGAFTIFAMGYITTKLRNNENTKRIAKAFLILYFSFMFFGVAVFKFGINSKKSMKDWYKIFLKCNPIKSMSSMHGLHKGEILQYKMLVSGGQNFMLMHGWYGKSFDCKTQSAAALICQRWFGIPTFFKWNFFPLGLAKLKRVKFEGKESIAMQYQLLPITDHFREYVDDDGNECWLGVMVIFGYKLMYFKLYKNK
eukprot:316430_1